MKKKSNIEKKNCFCGQHFSDYQKEEIRKTVCRDNSLDYKDTSGNLYCVFHFPEVSKSDDFAKALEKKLSARDYLFYGTWFPHELDFTGYKFEKYADFTWTTFNFDTSFEEVEFAEDCDFRCTHFLKKVSFKAAKFRDGNYVHFPTNFYSVTFHSIADFSNAEFFKEAKFAKSQFLLGYQYDENAEFMKFTTSTSFSDAVFHNKANFEGVSFGKKESEVPHLIHFNNITFKEPAIFRESEFYFYTYFSNSVFLKTADFRETLVVSSLGFKEAKFESYARFSGKYNNHKSWGKNTFSFSNVEIEKPERVFFQTLELKPSSFSNTDPRKFDFTDIRWKSKDFAFDWARFKDILWWTPDAKGRKTNYVKEEKIYRRFATYAEENHDYENASRFRFTAFDIQRITPWYGRLPITLLWWYKWTSRYGENWLWSLILLLCLVFAVFPSIYTQINFQTCSKDRPIAASFAICESKDDEIRKNCTCSTGQITFTDAIVQSLTTATLQNVEYRKPLTWRGELWIILEKIFAPLQAALLALAIRRKFMR